ncbi:MAG: hypothetical protein FWC40_09310, partial [Proteobacteria bacterium]|nr:hypothetical protein [Pseudomonadota bacterium]
TKKNKSWVVWLVGMCLLCMCGCSMQRAAIVEDLPRHRGMISNLARHDIANQVVFVSKGLYVTGIADGRSFSVGTWVRLVPGQRWPVGEPKPTLLVGRVAERKAHWARVEVLAMVDGLRADDPPVVEAYAFAKGVALHAVTKRLVYPATDVLAERGSVHVALSHADLAEGGEIYAAIDLNAPRGARLASRMTALLRVTEVGQTHARFQPIMGVVPQNPAFVLLDAQVTPAFGVRIVLHQMASGQDEAMAREIERLKSVWPHSNLARIEVVREGAAAYDAVRQALGQTQTHMLDVRIFDVLGHVQMLSHRERLSLSVWQLPLEGGDAEGWAWGALMEALAMLGDQAGVAFLGEQWLAARRTPLDWARVGPVLGAAYHSLERDDWALELALELGSMGAGADGRSDIAVAAIAAVIGRQQEFKASFSRAQQAAGKLSEPWLRLLWQAVMTASVIDSAFRDAERIVAQKMRQQKMWRIHDDALRCLMLGEEDEEACENGLAHAKTPFESRFFEALLHASQEGQHTAGTWAQQILAVDGLGAPFLAQTILLRLVPKAASAATRVLLLQNAAEYARKASQMREFLAISEILLRAQGLFPEDVQQPVSRQAIEGWRMLDRRAILGSALVFESQRPQTTDSEAIDLLLYAAELFLSIGDVHNAAIAHAGLAKRLEAIGKAAEASAHRERAKTLVVGHPSVTSVFD